MKKIFLLLLTLSFSDSFSQGYIEVKEEPFRRADMIVILADTLQVNTIDIAAKVLVKYDIFPKYVFKEYGSLISEYNSSKFIQLAYFINIVGNEIRIHAKYNSTIPIGNQIATSALAGKDAAQTQGVTLDYRDITKDYFEQMISIANEIKEKANCKKIVFVQRSDTIKY